MKPFHALRREMFDQDYRVQDLAKELNMSSASLSHRLIGRTPFDLETAYTILEKLGLPEEDLPKYFPRRGIGKEHRP